MNNLVRDYLHYLQLEKNASENTIASYTHDIRRYVEYLHHHRVEDPERVTEALMSRYIASLHRDGLSPRSVTRTLSAIKGFHRFLVGDGVVRANPAENIDRPKLPRSLPDVLSHSEVDAILSQPADSTGDNRHLWLRDRAILETLYATGMRVSELIKLKQLDVLATEGLVLYEPQLRSTSEEWLL